MADCPTHVKRCHDNVDFVINLPPAATLSVEWRVIALFYSALHVVKAFFANGRGNQPDPTNHQAMATAIRSNPLLKRILPDYQSLRALSERARYKPETNLLITPAEFEQAKQLHRTVVEHVHNQMRTDIPLPPAWP